MDRISNLPKTILHDILSRLPEKDVARTSVLSKAWKDTWSTFPILVFHEDRFESTRPRGNPTGNQEMEILLRNKFLDFVENTMLRFHDHHLAIRELKLTMFFIDSQSISRMDHWMTLAIESGVKVLDLCVSLGFHDVSFDKYYCLPAVVLKAKSLNKLILHGHIMLDQSFLNNPAMFSSLQELSLSNVYADEQIIWNFISCCALIEYITLECCSGLKYVKIHGLTRLKGVKIRGIEEVDVNSPSLENFSYHPGRRNIPCKVNIDKCKNLRELHLTCTKPAIITCQWFDELSQKFPLLESLTLNHCPISRKIKISNPKLKILTIYGPSKLKEAHIDAPNICLSEYYVDEHYLVDQYPIMPNICFPNHSGQLRVNLAIAIESIWDFLRLRRFLQNFNTSDIVASLHGFYIDDDLPEDFTLDVYQDFSVHPPMIKSISLIEFPDDEALILPLVTALLWGCHPSSIFTGRWDIAKLLCEKLLEGADENCYCSSREFKCWFHGLKDVRITLQYDKNNQKVFDCN